VSTVSFRCDGDDARIGAGHVARCLRIALALRARGAEVRFDGRYDGIAASLLERAGVERGPGGDAIVVDSYEIPPAEIEALGRQLPVAAIWDAGPAPAVRAVLSFQPDAAELVPVPPGTAAFQGPQYAPVDPALTGARRERGLERALVTLGASERGRRLVPAASRALAAAGVVHVQDAPVPGGLLEAIRAADVAVSAAGVTAYELACAGVPAVLIAIADNHMPLIRAFERLGAAVAVDGRGGRIDANAVRVLGDPQRRAAMAAAGPRVVDGRGADRAADALASVLL
jgi:spore coat polysaccharide biosynthesis predicted glycosyltransferase SpsG